MCKMIPNEEIVISAGQEIIEKAFAVIKQSSLDYAEKNLVLQDVGDYLIAVAISGTPKHIKEELMLSSRLHIEDIVERLERHDETLQ